MVDQASFAALQRQLKQRGVHLNTLHALLRIAELDTGKPSYRKERAQRLCTFVSMMGGVREPDLVAIARLTQPDARPLVPLESQLDTPPEPERTPLDPDHPEATQP